MSRNIVGKLNAGETLTDEEVAYAVDHAIPLPEEYGQQVGSYTEEMIAGKPSEPLFQTGAAFSPPPGTGVFLTEDQLGSLSKNVLKSIAEVQGVEVSGTKNEMLSDLLGGEAEGGEEGDEE